MTLPTPALASSLARLGSLLSLAALITQGWGFGVRIFPPPTLGSFLKANLRAQIFLEPQNQHRPGRKTEKGTVTSILLMGA